MDCTSGRLFLILLFTPLLLVPACAKYKPNPVIAMLCNDYHTAEKSFEEEKDISKSNSRNYVLCNMEWGSAAVHGGDDLDAFKALSKASTGMRYSTGGETRGTASLVIHESLKKFKGEPFEKGMANIYLGILYYRKGDFDNARACFQQAIIADGASEPEYRDDFSLAYFLQGRCDMKIGDNDNAEICFNNASRSWPDNYYLSLEANRNSNVIAIIEMGNCPYKIRRGVNAEKDDFKELPYPEDMAMLKIDGQEVAVSSKILDINLQARTRGKSGKDMAQLAKGIFAGMVRLGIWAFTFSDPGPCVGALTGSFADIRQCWYLPGEVHIIAYNMEPGEHTVSLSFYADEKVEMPSYRQVWHRVPVYSEMDNLWLFKSAPFMQAKLVKCDDKKVTSLDRYDIDYCYTKEAHAGRLLGTWAEAQIIGLQ